MGDTAPTRQRVVIVDDKPTLVKAPGHALSMLQQAKEDWEILRSRPPQEPRMEPEQEAALADLEEEVKA